MTFQNLIRATTGVHLYESKHSRGSSISGHYHDYFQILYALEGEGEIVIDQIRYDFSKDKIVLITPNSIHSIQAFTHLTVLVLAFSKPGFTLYGENEFFRMVQQKSQYYDLDIVRASDVRQLLRKMLFEQTDYDSFCSVSLPVYLCELLLILVRLQSEKELCDMNEIRAIQIKEFIDRNYFGNITAENLSLKFEISPRYINSIFKAKFHETPLQYLQKIRINRAKEMLIETNKEIVSISFEIGYETLSSFYRAFRNLVGISPHKFRLLNKQ